MEFLREYAAAVTAGAVICSLLLCLARSGSQSALIRFLCGIYLTVILVRPLTGCSADMDLTFTRQAADSGTIQARLGEDLYRQTVSQRISAETEAYILEKADQHGAAIRAQVTVGEDLLPEYAQLRGAVSDTAKEALSRILEEDLGIAKENQLWTG